MKKFITLIVVLIVLGAAGAGGWYYKTHIANASSAAQTSTDPSATVATVDGTAITQGQLTTAEKGLEAQVGTTASTTAEKLQLQNAALNSLISRQLLLSAAATAGMTASSTQVESQLAAARSQFTSTSTYEKALSDRGLTADAFRTQISDGLVVNAFLEQQLHLSAATATDAEIQTAYDNVAKQQSNVPALSQVRSQVAQAVVQQKQQAAISQFVQQLRAKANVQILISTSTPAA